MLSLFTPITSTYRFVKICLILFWQICVVWPYRLLQARGARRSKHVSPYLRPPLPGTSAAEMAKDILEKLGPTYVKFGQFMSIRPDLIPQEFCSEFRKLQDKVPPFPFALVRREIRNELKNDIEGIFSEFDERPLAAASVSQIHRARLHTGEEVAVKVQRPGIRDDMVSDILIMLFFARIAVLVIPSLRKHQPAVLIQEFSRWTDRELYFRQEGKNSCHFATNFKNYPNVRFPRIYREHTTRKILVMEYISGDNVLHASGDTSDRKAAAALIVDTMLKQIFIDGFFHGDPHAGNILLTGKGSIAYLDFGIVGYLSEDLRAWIFDILYGMSRRDVPRVISSFLELCNVEEGDIDMAGYCRQMNEILSELTVYEEAGIPFSQMMKRFLYTSLEYGIEIPSEFVLVTKSLTTFEGTCLTLDPEIRIVEQLRAFVKKHIAKLPSRDEALERLQAAPFEMERVKRLALKHGARVLRFFENPVITVEQAGRGVSANGRGGSMSMIIAALIIFAGLTSNDTAFEQWLRTYFTLPPGPLLPTLGLGTALVLGLATIMRRRRN